jgi:hypothetical protein
MHHSCLEVWSQSWLPESESFVMERKQRKKRRRMKRRAGRRKLQDCVEVSSSKEVRRVEL